MTETVLVTGGSGFGSFDAAIDGCRYVFHVASPFLLPEQIKATGTDVITPAVEGTRNIIAGTSTPRAPPRTTPTTTPRRWPSKPPGTWPGHRTAGRW
jgi:hypothetical protein